MKPICKKISSLGLVTLFHAGHDYGFNPPFKAMPDNILGALRWFDSRVLTEAEKEKIYCKNAKKLLGI